MDLKKVNTELEAYHLCRDNGLDIKFQKQFYQTPECVIIKVGIRGKIAGTDIVEAVNRVVDFYRTPPNEYKDLDWWEDHLRLINT